MPPTIGLRRGLAHEPTRPRLPHPAVIFGGWDTMLHGPGKTADALMNIHIPL